MHRKTSALTGNRLLGLGRNALLGLLAAIAFFVASASLSYLTVQNIKGNSARVTQTHALIVALDLLLIDVQDAETGLRGYLLTGDDGYLDPYNRCFQTRHHEGDAPSLRGRGRGRSSGLHEDRPRSQRYGWYPRHGRATET